jgi:hypothetical protein
MTFRIHILAAIMATRTFMAATLAATGAFSLAQLLCPMVTWFIAIYFIIPFVVILLEIINAKPRYKPDLSYPCGYWIAGIAVGFFVLVIVSRIIYGGVPEVIEVNGYLQCVAVNHSKMYKLSFYEFYILVASLPLAMTGLLLHVLLEHRWRYSRR